MKIPLLATVQCRSEGQAEQRPIAVVIGGRRLAIEAVVEDAVFGTAVAGEPVTRRLEVVLEDDQCLFLERRLPDGVWRVSRDSRT